MTSMTFLANTEEEAAFVFFAVVTLSYFVYRLLRTKLDNDRRATEAQIEADLRLKLAEKLGDPAQVQQILETPLRAYEPEKASLRAESPQPKKALHSRVPTASRRFLTRFVVFVGLMLFLLGVAFIIGATLTGEDDLTLAGLICGATGLAFLTFATSQKEILRAVGQDPRAQGS